MQHVGRGALALSAGLAAVAGFVDAVGYLDTGGLFVSFMSGNSTQGAVDVPTSLALAAVPLGLIAAFVSGVVVGGVVRPRSRRAQAGVIAGSALAVGLVALLATAGPSTLWRAGLLAAAMGALNTLFLAEDRARVAITYSTGTLVSLGLGLAALLTGRSRTAWRRPLLLWAALVAGAVLGAFAHRLGSPAALVAAAAAMLVAAVVVRRARRT
ncbi:YoaK family protein [Microbacterium sp. KSW2-29]|uniref:YoaK family protein n=1 Tax=Microbacterium phycohabitans TaxID=3075993 RepID=A0ABU3SN48_9MICO|nr:YoaK family protein [Microbacterium sp. KSW2-29]MDU0346262.1 YoaK family protein [Microbacterium sp. KSW2-29]